MRRQKRERKGTWVGLKSATVAIFEDEFWAGAANQYGGKARQVHKKSGESLKIKHTTKGGKCSQANMNAEIKKGRPSRPMVNSIAGGGMAKI